eukprot:5193588-Amphidinium_carterae.1
MVLSVGYFNVFGVHSATVWLTPQEKDCFTTWTHNVFTDFKESLHCARLFPTRGERRSEEKTTGDRLDRTAQKQPKEAHPRE